MLSVTFGVSTEVLHSALTGGNSVNHVMISIFQCLLGIFSMIIFIIMSKLSQNISSPTIRAELLGWKLNIAYSLGMSLAFFLSFYLEKTRLSFITPYFDQIVAVIIMVFMLPESMKILWQAIKEIFLFSPDQELVDEIKKLCTTILEQHQFIPIFFDITKTGRHLWIAIYFQIESNNLFIHDLSKASKLINKVVNEKFHEATCELILKA